MSKDFKLSMALAVGSLIILMIGLFTVSKYLDRNSPTLFSGIGYAINYLSIAVPILIIEYVGIILWAISKTKKKLT